MGRVNKKYEQKVHRRCPVCDKRVRVGHRSYNWWVYCEDGHIPQERYPSPSIAISMWETNGKQMMSIDEAIKTLKEETCYECSYGCDSAYSCEHEYCVLRIATRIAVDCMKKANKEEEYEHSS